MTQERAKRRLTAILSADVKGYSRLMGKDEYATVDTMKKYREVIAFIVQQYNGRVVDSPGDNILAEFGSVVDAVEASDRCVVLIQTATCEGYELPSVGLIIFASMDYSYRNGVQLKGRFLRSNKPKKNVYIHLIAGEADKAIYDAFQRGEDFDVLKFNREKKYGKKKTIGGQDIQ